MQRAPAGASMAHVADRCGEQGSKEQESIGMWASMRKQSGKKEGLIEQGQGSRIGSKDEHTGEKVKR